VAAVALAAGGLHAQSSPAQRTTRLIVITPPGGIVDSSARWIAERLAQRTGRPVVVENRTGAGGNIAAEVVAKAPADGSTLLYTSNNFTTNAYLYRKLSFDPRKDFEPVIQVGDFSMVLVAHPSVPAKSLNELVALSKAKPELLSYGSGGNGHPGHIATELVKSQSGAKFQHVPYKGAGQAMTDAIGGQVQLAIGSLGSALPFIKSGQVKPIAVTGRSRSPSAPDIPTMAEAGLKGYDYNGWIGILAPRGTPKATVEQLHVDIAAVLAMPEVKQKMDAQGGSVVEESTAKFKAMLDADFERNHQLIVQGAVKPEGD
jgi:tripartite-type tricarboxylate transporter receptor subunit TctC